MRKGIIDDNINQLNEEIMKNLNPLYETPCLEVIEIQVEQSILTDSYGGPGEPGQGSGFLDGGDI